MPALRIALISIAGDGAADARLAGHPLAWHQVQAAIALACEKVVCLADAPGQELASLQHEAEQRGASFHAIAHHRALAGLVRAADTLLVFAPGVLPDRDWLAQAFGARAGVAVLPAEDAVELGYERIDRDRAWAGVLATRGDAVEALSALPPDADAIGGLLRVALQRGAGAIAVPDKWLDDGRWAMVGSSDAAVRYQAGWYLRHVPPPSFDRPAEALAYRAARALVQRVRDGATASTVLLASGVGLALISAIAGYLGRASAGTVGLAIASAGLAIGTALGRLSRAGSGEASKRWTEEARRALLDLSLIAIAASPGKLEGWTTVFAALMVVGVIRLAEEDLAPRVMRPLSDRTLVLAGLAVATGFGVLSPALALLALAGLAVRLFWPSQQLTRA